MTEGPALLAGRTFTIRATQVSRREDGDWRVVHRHADSVA